LTGCGVQHDLLTDHLRALRSRRTLRHAQIVFIPESNLGLEAQHAIQAIERSVPRITDWCALAEGAQGGAGLLTTHDSKAAMCKALQELLEFDALGMVDDIVCLSMDKEDAVSQLLAEMRAYSIVVEPPKSLFGKAKQTFSGKIGGQQDDMVIALQLAILGSRLFVRKDRYAAFR
tara:strand:- start:3152 stop:3676 length:525 start_codon:yes stop_codon:yes gene_type:complete